MSTLFQTSVLNKFLAAQDEAQINEAFEKFSAHFLNPSMQSEIRSMKEEEYQDGFLNDLFVRVLDYTLRPNEGYELIREKKNETNGKKADGAILKDGNALAVIELKGTDTKDLEKIADQAFGYKNNQPECVYVVTSNFEKLRFYIHNAVEHEEFNLFTLTYERFKLLWLFLQKDNLLGGIPAKVKEESLLEEEKVTKRLYKDYSAFKNDLWNNMVQRNPQHDPLLLYKKSQKLLDRFLFIFFAEDKGLLPPNSISVIVDDWSKLKDLDAYKPLYSRFKKYFGYMNDGFKGQRYEIHAYNGGLFKPDPLLDGLIITDEVLERHVLKLTEYDFESEVDTNILGHIFEHSLNDIENVRAQLAGEEVDKSKTKRKKDGVFYTPKYITKYIVNNTVGKLCEEKKAELGIYDEAINQDFIKKGGKLSAKGSAFNDLLTKYRNWLLDLKIVDPACGSGAFLNQALEFLMSEHDYVDSLVLQIQRMMQGGVAQISADVRDIQNEILENNIYGVDINEESVEIARLSLWLRTAQKGRKLTTLSSNIKCGNSLIDDPEVAGDLAFNWQREFPKVFEKGGFDVVIGNPPYVVYLKSNVGETVLNYLSSKYDFAEYNPNTYAMFTELGLRRLLQDSGRLGFIIPNSWMSGKYFTRMRKGVYNSQVEEIDYLKDEVFSEVVETVVLMIRNVDKAPMTIKLSEDVQQPPIETKFEKAKFLEGHNPFIAQDNPVVNRIESGSATLGEFAFVYRGLETRNNKIWLSESKDSELHVPILLGRDVHRYAHSHSGTFVKFIKSEMKSNANEKMYTQPKVLMRRTGSTIIADLDMSNQFALKNLYVITPKNKASVYSIIAQLNSRLFAFIHKMKTSAENKAFAQFQGVYVSGFPYREMPVSIEEHIREMQMTTSKRGDCVNNFISLLQSEFDYPKPSKKLLSWFSLEFKDFLAELKKVKVVLSLDQKEEWMGHFNKKKAEANALQSEIDRIDREIDQMVYELYGLSEEEIKIVEGR